MSRYLQLLLHLTLKKYSVRSSSERRLNGRQKYHAFIQTEFFSKTHSKEHFSIFLNNINNEFIKTQINHLKKLFK